MVTATKPRHRVLVVDDEEIVARGIARVLRGYDITMASSAKEGAELATAIDPALVITDFYLPDGTGRDVIKALRDGGSTAPVLLMSGAVDLEKWSEWAVSLADDFLPKPFLSEQLRAKAEKLIQNYERELLASRAAAELAAMHERNDRETAAARVLLDRMLARSEFPPDQVRVESIAAGQFGGDVVFGGPLANGTYRWLVGDVTGHTLASALVTIPISQVYYAYTRLSVALVDVVETINSELNAMLPVTMFFTATACELDRVRGTLSVINAGCPDVLLRRTDGTIQAFGSTLPPLGILKNDLQAMAEVVKVLPGDRVYAFTDGLVELQGADGEMFGMDRVREILTSSEPDDVYRKLRLAWREYAGELGSSDDLSIIEVIV